MSKFTISLSFLLSLLLFILWQYDFVDVYLLAFDFKLLGRSSFEILFNLLTFAPFVLFFSVAASLSKGFRNWWKFARYSIPLIILVVFFVNLHLHHSQGASGFINFEDAMDRAFILFLYTIFSVVSVWILLRTYWQGSELAP